MYLLRGLVMLTEEAGTLADGRLVHLGTRGTDAGGVELCFQRDVSAGQGPCFHRRCQFFKAPAHLRPGRQLEFKKTVNLCRVGLAVPAAHHLAPGTQFQCAQAVFIEIVLILFLNGKGCVGVAFPTAAQVEHIVDAADAPLARNAQTQGIVLAVTGIGKAQAAEQRGEECPGRAKPVNAQGIVASVVVGPLAVVDNARRQCVELEVH